MDHSRERSMIHCPVCNMDFPSVCTVEEAAVSTQVWADGIAQLLTHLPRTYQDTCGDKPQSIVLHYVGIFFLSFLLQTESEKTCSK